MSFLGRLFGKKQDPLFYQAAGLVEAARINAVGMFTPLRERFQLLGLVDTEHWDFILTVAGIFMASTRLTNLRLSEERQGRLMEIIAERLSDWKPEGIRGFEDCKGVFEREYDSLEKTGHDPQFLAADAVGMWIVLNVLGHLPQTREECELVRSTGAMTTHTFFDWWGNG